MRPSSATYAIASPVLPVHCDGSLGLHSCLRIAFAMYGCTYASCNSSPAHVFVLLVHAMVPTPGRILLMDDSVWCTYLLSLTSSRASILACPASPLPDVDAWY